jgi:PIN domain nuclease of toxin-antitoxin system
VAVRASLTPLLRDPADQLVVATALERGARVVTSDARIAGAEAVTVIA